MTTSHLVRQEALPLARVTVELETQGLRVNSGDLS